MTLDHFSGEIRHKQDCHCAVIKEKEEHFVTFLISKERPFFFFFFFVIPICNVVLV